MRKSVFVNWDTFEMWVPACFLPLCSLLPSPEALAPWLHNCALTSSQAPGGSGAQLSEPWQGGNSTWCTWQGADSGERHIRGEGWLGAPVQLHLVHELPPAASVPVEYWKTCWAENRAWAVKLVALLCQSAFQPCHINLELPHSSIPLMEAAVCSNSEITNSMWLHSHWIADWGFVLFYLFFQSLKP